MLLEPLVADPGAPLARAHPLAKIGAALVLMLALFLTIDPVTPTLALAAIAAALPALGLRPATLARRAAPLFVAATGLAIFNAVVTGDVRSAIALALRVVAIALAGIIGVASVDPTELADALVEHLRAPRRFAVGALAAFRLMPLFAGEWVTIGLARRARGLDDDASPLARVAGLVGATRLLLVGAVRRATRLAVAMDGRGFADATRGTLARPRPLTRRDWALLAGSVAVALLTTAISLALGAWRFFLAH